MIATVSPPVLAAAMKAPAKAVLPELLGPVISLIRPRGMPPWSSRSAGTTPEDRRCSLRVSSRPRKTPAILEIVAPVAAVALWAMCVAPGMKSLSYYLRFLSMAGWMGRRSGGKNDVIFGPFSRRLIPLIPRYRRAGLLRSYSSEDARCSPELADFRMDCRPITYAMLVTIGLVLGMLASFGNALALTLEAFDINRTYYVQDVEFTGNRAISTAELDNVIQTHPRPLLQSWKFWQKPPLFDPETF